MEEAEFTSRARAILQQIADATEKAADSAEAEADVELDNGVLTIELESIGTYVVNQHAPLMQIWISSPVSGASHYVWDENNWVSTRSGKILSDSLSAELSEQLGSPVNFGNSE